MNNSSERKSMHQYRVGKNDVTYDDDGFFSDVPVSGSLSRSMLALNEYVKSNLLFGDSEDYKDYKENDDAAYFSKESSPNDSVVRYETDSLKSNDSAENNDARMTSDGKLNAICTPIEESSLTDDCKFLQLQDLPKQGTVNTKNDLEPEVISRRASYESERDNKETRIFKNTVVRIEYSDIRSVASEDSNQNLYQNIPPRPESPHIDETSFNSDFSDTHSQTTNENYHHDYATNYRPTYSTSLDDDRSINSSLTDYTIETDNARYNRPRSEYYVNESKTIDTPSSFDNFAVEKSVELEGNDSDVFVRRKNGYELRKKSNRHTLHEFSKWGNRTDVYPDVYAPLPYKSPRRYVESDVNIHYRCPVRHDPLPLVPERELARQQAEHMKRLYREQRRNKYLQELQDMQNRRHQDNFTPSQKTVVPLNRYDEADKVIAKALYTFNGQTARELSFRKGDIIHVRRQIDSNWYEGEVHGKIGLFPYNYVELQKGDTVQTLKKPAVVEGRARAKFDFTAQTNLELPLKKGEVVVLTRRIDQNWWEGRNGVKTGIFPDSYVTILQEPSPSKPELKPILSTEKPMASPAAHGLLNGSDKRSMGAHSYTPQQNSAALANAPPASQPLPGYAAKPAQAMTPSERGYGPPTGAGVDLNNTEPLYVDTNAEAVPYRAMYKYRPQNPDELELCEGDTVYVLEQCDDGWYVGSSQRTGRFGTFPGNYVERI